ncbi:MAG: dTDP-4-amino-4,6-dideoxygalactose transaminase [Saprospiraceae bacterium]|nr:dTDP-4-amino-4,6-dideoxygalactose transaminase [Saprospiraceae bacterium]
MKIPFNKPFLTGDEINYIKHAVNLGKISGNGNYTKKCQTFFESKYGIKKALLTTSCTDALEMAALLLRIKPGDEVIVPSFTFVSTANAFVLRGAKIVFIDSKSTHPNLDETKLEALINSKTKAIVVVHYAGVACEMDTIMQLSQKYDLFVIEDAAQGIDSFYKGRPLGSIGHLSTFSFHETKNIISGEGGLLGINDERFLHRSEIIWEKGTNRAAFFRGEIDKYGWVDLGSSFLPSEIIAAFLWAQIEHINSIQSRRKQIWNRYFEELNHLEQIHNINLPQLPQNTTNNGHLFYLICETLNQRTQLIEFLKKKNIHAVFHYLSLHDSPFFKEKHDSRSLLNSDKYSNRLLRLPLYYELSEAEQSHIISSVNQFFNV